MGIVPRHFRLFLWMAPILGLNWLLLASLNPDPGQGTVLELATLGLCFGTLFAHTTLVAAWSAFGPVPVAWRLPLSLIWILLLALGIGVNMSTNGGAREAAIMFGGLMLGQWLLLQIPLWGIAIGYGIRLQHRDDRSSNPRQQQFGIRQLLTITTLVGVMFGLGRLLVSAFLDRLTFDGKDYALLAFLGVAAVSVTLPLLLAALMRRHAIPAAVLAVALITLVTYSELPLLQALLPGPGAGPRSRDFIAINVGASVVMLFLLMIVRLNGYCLAFAPTRTQPQVVAG
jgi:hypothetical protein